MNKILKNLIGNMSIITVCYICLNSSKAMEENNATQGRMPVVEESSSNNTIGSVINTNNANTMNCNNDETKDIINNNTIDENNITREKEISILKTIVLNNNTTPTQDQIKLIQILSKQKSTWDLKNFKTYDYKRDLISELLDYGSFSTEVLNADPNDIKSMQCYANFIAMINYCYKAKYINKDEYKSILTTILYENVARLFWVLKNAYFSISLDDPKYVYNVYGFIKCFLDDMNAIKEINNRFSYEQDYDPTEMYRKYIMDFIKQIIGYLAKTEVIDLLNISDNNRAKFENLIYKKLYNEIYKPMVIDILYKVFNDSLDSSTDETVVEDKKKELDKYSKYEQIHIEIAKKFGFDKIFKSIKDYMAPRYEKMNSSFNKTYNNIGKKQDSNMNRVIKNKHIFKDIVNTIPQPRRYELMRKLREDPQVRKQFNEKLEHKKEK